MTSPAPILQLEGVSVRLPLNADRKYAIHDVSLDLFPNEILCLVGESGSGKSMASSAIMRLLPQNVSVSAGHVKLDGNDLLSLNEAQMRQVRGAQIALVFQEPLTALNPRSEEHTSELQTLMRISYAVSSLKKKIHMFKIRIK